jgi:hypothetical protein
MRVHSFGYEVTYSVFVWAIIALLVLRVRHLQMNNKCEGRATAPKQQIAKIIFVVVCITKFLSRLSA